MRSIVYKDSKMQMIELPEPQITKADDVKIKVAYCGICGSDLHIARKEMDFMFQGIPFFPMGHEASGTIVELGEGATSKGLKVGDKVVYYFNEHCGKCYYCRNGQENFCENLVSNTAAMSDYIVVGEQSVYKVSEGMELTKAALTEPLTVCMHGMDLINMKPGSSVFISGGGVMGMIFLQLAKLSGGVKLTLSEPIASKREIALKNGAQYVIDPMNQDVVEEAMKITNGRGYDVVIECSGSVAACPPAFKVTGKGGTLEFFAALYRADYNFEFNLQEAFMKEIKIISGVLQSPYTWPRSQALLETMDVTSFFKDNVFEADDYEKAFDAQLNGKVVKALIKFS